MTIKKSKNSNEKLSYVLIQTAKKIRILLKYFDVRFGFCAGATVSTFVMGVMYERKKRRCDEENLAAVPALPMGPKV